MLSEEGREVQYFIYFYIRLYSNHRTGRRVGFGGHCTKTRYESGQACIERSFAACKRFYDFDIAARDNLRSKHCCDTCCWVHPEIRAGPSGP